jgi:predicted aspartyl protease
MLMMMFVGGTMSIAPVIVLNGFLTWFRQQWNDKALFRETFFPVLLVGNTLLVVCFILFLPGKTSQALHQHGNWLFDKKVASFLEINEQHMVLRTGRKLVRRMAYLLEVESHRARLARRHQPTVPALHPDRRTAPKTHRTDAGQGKGLPDSRSLAPPLRPLSPPPPAPSMVQTNKVVRLQFRRHGSVPEVPLTLGTIQTKYLWDTGASFLTLTRNMAHKLNASPGFNAPTITVHTANGRVKTRVGLLRAVTIGSFRLHNVAFVLCDACADTGHGISGLLGANIQRRFRFSVDHSQGHIELRPQPGALWKNQALDMRPFLRPKRMKGSTLNLYVRRVFRLRAFVTNNAPATAKGLVYQISYMRGRRIVGRRTLHVLPLRPGQRRKLSFMDKKAPKFDKYRMELIEGHWSRR